MLTSFHYCEELRTIPESKVSIYKNSIISNCTTCSKIKYVSCDICGLKSKILDRYILANIPIDYWNKGIDDFFGDQRLVELYKSISEDITAFYKKGNSYCFKGQHGVGKTFFSTLVLKKAVEKGYGGLYTTLGDIVNVVVCGAPSARFNASRELKMVDWLVIDEFDSRFYNSESTAELFGRVLESIIRIRFQNCMPTFLITNNPDPTKSLGDMLGASISSLMSGYVKEVCVIGRDARKK